MTETEKRTDPGFVIEDGVLKKYEGPGGVVTVPRGVDVIAGYAFSGNRDLTELRLPVGLKRIGDYAFRSCRSLERVTLPEGLESIGSGAFTRCGSLREITFPRTLRELRTAAFGVCGSLETVRFPRDTPLRRISPETFSKCRSLKTVELPDRITEICWSAFEDCGALRELRFPPRLRRIEGRAFSNCVSLGGPEFPEGLEEIDTGASFGCGSLRTLRLPAGLKRIGPAAFSDCGDLDVTVTNVKTEGQGVFVNCRCRVTAPAWTYRLSLLFPYGRLETVDVRDFTGLRGLYVLPAALHFVRSGGGDEKREREIVDGVRILGLKSAPFALKHPELLHWMCARGLIEARDEEAWLDAAGSSGSVECRALLLNRRNERLKGQAEALCDAREEDENFRI